MARIDIGPQSRSVRDNVAGHNVFAKVLACVDCSSQSTAALTHAAEIARVTGAQLLVIRILETSPNNKHPTDPVDWTQKHRIAKAELQAQAASFGSIVSECIVEDGMAAERICDFIRDNQIDLTVLGIGGERNGSAIGLGSTARKIAEMAEGSVLLAPCGDNQLRPVSYKRVMTPLDGSPRAESALPIAVALATAHQAEILLVHAAPNVDLTETGPLEPETMILRDRLRRRNERVGAHYLKKVQSWLPASDVRHSSRLIASGDPRHAVDQAANDHRADLVVLSSTGYGAHPGQGLGSVAEFLISRAQMPVLLVRDRSQPGPAQAIRLPDMTALRLPQGASL